MKNLIQMVRTGVDRVGNGMKSAGRAGNILLLSGLTSAMGYLTGCAGMQGFVLGQPITGPHGSTGIQSGGYYDKDGNFQAAIATPYGAVSMPDNRSNVPQQNVPQQGAPQVVYVEKTPWIDATFFWNDENKDNIIQDSEKVNSNISFGRNYRACASVRNGAGKFVEIKVFRDGNEVDRDSVRCGSDSYTVWKEVTPTAGEVTRITFDANNSQRPAWLEIK